jgi:hypothetical protein
MSKQELVSAYLQAFQVLKDAAKKAQAMVDDVREAATRSPDAGNVQSVANELREWRKVWVENGSFVFRVEMKFIPTGPQLDARCWPPDPGMEEGRWPRIEDLERTLYEYQVALVNAQNAWSLLPHGERSWRPPPDSI